jgi:DNA-binding IclR family transcriptional regulator
MSTAAEGGRRFLCFFDYAFRGFPGEAMKTKKKIKEKQVVDVTTRYAVPALDKGLDIVELLVRQNDGLTLSEIARQLDRTPSELFRMVTTLCRRGYVVQRDGNRYSLTLQMFELAHRHQPLRSLTAVSMPHMRELVDRSSQSCYLTIYNEGRVLIIADVDNPERWSFSMKVGGVLGLTNTASGQVLLAFQSDAERTRMLERHEPVQGEPTLDRKKLNETLAAVQRRGYAQAPCPAVRGVVTTSHPVLGTSANAVAALNIPFVERVDRSLGPTMEGVREILQEIAMRLSLLMGYVA